MRTLVALVLALAAGTASADPLEGLWRTAPDVNGHEGLVRIAPCGPALCGTLISATGSPALSVPGGFTPDGLPVGLQIIGAPRADRKVLEVGHAFEQATRFGERRPAL